MIRPIAIIGITIGLGATFACSHHASNNSGSAALTAASPDQILADLSFLTNASSIELIDPTSAEGQTDLGLLNDAIQADPDTPDWIANAGSESAPHIVNVTLNDGTTATLATREWLSGDPSQPDSRSAITYVSHSSDPAFGYAEEHLFQGGGVDVASFWTLDHGSPDQAAGYTFDPSTAEQQNIDANAGDVQGQAAGATLRLQAGSGGSNTDTSTSCALCADGLLTLKVVGVVAAYATGTGAATAVCALVGIPTAEVGGVACHLVVAALSLAATIPLAFSDRESLCNYLSNTILGMNPICASAPVGDGGASGGGGGATAGICAGTADGVYCGADFDGGGDPNTLYQCAGGGLASSQVCQNGCQANGNGADACN